MIKSLLTLVLLFYSSIYSQSTDSLIVIGDSIKVDITENEETDSIAVNDSLMNKTAVPDTLVPVKEEPVSNVTNIIDKRNFLFANYRYTGDFLRSFQLNFVKDFAFLGYPNETFVYGAGFGGITFLEDGVLRNDRFSNSLNLNEVQSEDIDSIEVIPSPRGFLFGPFNNAAAVNFIMKDFISPEPYTRIKYYEGPDGEAMIDGKFNSRIYKRWNLSFQVTNRASDNRYLNTDYSMWQINAKIKYYLSNEINIALIYQSVDSEVGLNGGVDVDSIAMITNDINSELYDQQTGYVNYTQRVQKVLNHNFRLKTQILPWYNAKADISLFYRYSDNEIYNDLDSVVAIDRYDNKNSGVALNFHQRLNIFTFQLLSNYEKNSTLVYANYLSGNDITIDHDYYSVSTVISSSLADGKIIPSVFGKYSGKSDLQGLSNQKKYGYGFGADLVVKPLSFLSLYGGFSINDQFGNTNSKNLEFGATLKNKMMLADLKIFSRDDFIPFSVQWNTEGVKQQQNSIKGVGLLLNVKLWKILLESNSSYYFDQAGSLSTSLPDVQFIGGIYLNDYFFDSNLLLKAGFKFYYTGKLSANTENSGIVEVDPSNKVDFTLAGEIKKVAIVYFIWENLANNNYFITPYYPMPERSIRFGLSWELFN